VDVQPLDNPAAPDGAHRGRSRGAAWLAADRSSEASRAAGEAGRAPF